MIILESIATQRNSVYNNLLFIFQLELKFSANLDILKSVSVSLKLWSERHTRMKDNVRGLLALGAHNTSQSSASINQFIPPSDGQIDTPSSDFENPG